MHITCIYMYIYTNKCYYEKIAHTVLKQAKVLWSTISLVIIGRRQKYSTRISLKSQVASEGQVNLSLKETDTCPDQWQVISCFIPAFIRRDMAILYYKQQYTVSIFVHQKHLYIFTDPMQYLLKFLTIWGLVKIKFKFSHHVEGNYDPI